MKFRAPKGGLALHSVAMVIEHMVLQTVKPRRPVLISDTGECMMEGGHSSTYGKSGVHKHLVHETLMQINIEFLSLVST